MIILDTNVVSELMKPLPAERVSHWVAQEPAGNLCTTSITQAEILHGVLLLVPGRKRKALEAAVEAMFEQEFAGRVLAFDSDAARAYATIAVERRHAGRPISQFDAQIAAIARCTGAVLATRNAADFDHCGFKVVNPWI